MDKSEKELLDRHVKLFLSDDFDTLHNELFSIGFVSAAADLMTEEQVQKAHAMTRKRMRSMLNEIYAIADAENKHRKEGAQ